MRKLFIGGNWKMHKTVPESLGLARNINNKTKGIERVDILICPPFTSLSPVSEVLDDDGHVALGAQNMHWKDEGAYTGEISPPMIKSTGAKYVIIGHSERRHIFGEENEGINKKVRKALFSDLKVILCIGEKLEQRNNDETYDVLSRQIEEGLANVNLATPDDLTIAYEPVWAIGTGETATPEQAEEAHSFIRKVLADKFTTDYADKIRIQYGGSVKPHNAESILSEENVDGALIGGASLEDKSFVEIVEIAKTLK